MANFTPQELEEILQQFFDVTGKRQYIGARYVPIFGRKYESSIEWDNSSPYEPLTIVLYHGDSYTSRKYVPAGVDIMDTNYWAVTGRFNAQVEQYRQEVIGFADDIQAVQNNVDLLRTDVENDYVPFPDVLHYPKYGTSGQVLSTLANGTTKWENPVIPSDAQAEEVITAWLTAHPEATTTVQNDSVTDAKLKQTGNVLSAVRSIQGDVMLGYGKYVDYDTTNGTLTFPPDSLIVRKTQNGTLTHRQLSPAGTPYVVDVSYNTIGTTAVRLFFDMSSSDIVPLGYAASVPEEYIYIGAMRLKRSSYPGAISASFPWSIDGVPYGNTIPNDSVTDAKLKQTGNVLSAVRSIQGDVMLGYGKYVDYDTTNGTLTFPPDSLIVRKTQNGTLTHRQLSPAGTPYVVDVSYNTIGTTAVRLFFDMSSSDIVPLGYAASVPEEYIYIGAMRLKRSSYPGAISASFPWSIDGVPYGNTIPTPFEYAPLISESCGNAVKSINHRGYCTVAPENTIPAYRLSCEHHFLKVECDVSFTSDNVAVLLHDETINRTARNPDGTAIGETINIGDITYAQALNYDFGIWKGAQYAGTKIPTLYEFLTFCRSTGLHPYIEIKSNVTYTSTQIEDIVDIVNATGMRGKVSYISFSTDYLTYVKNYDTSARLGFIVNTVSSNSITTAQGLNTSQNEVFIDAYATNIDATQIALCRNALIPLEVWTVDTLSELYDLDPYITGVTSNTLLSCSLLYNHALEE